MSSRPYPILAVRMLLGVVLTAALGCGEKPSGTRIPVINPPVPPMPAPSRPMSRPPDAGPATMTDALEPFYPGPGPDGPAAESGAPACEDPPATRKRAGERCACDNECTTGFCQEGACCTGTICGRRAPGAPCQQGDQCESGFCADGVCCNVACSGSCVSCNQPDRTGECVAAPAGQRDPHEVCRRETEETCGLSGFCNGQGGCARYAPGTACGAAICSGPRTFVAGGECDGDGVCIKGEPLDCAPFTCEGNNCRSSCVADTDCVSPNICAAGRCGLRGRGQACTAGEQCQTGFCVDGVCCDNACAGRCSFCASPSTRGTCTQVRAGTIDPRAAAGITDPARACLDRGAAACGTNGRCDGRAGCQRYDDGTTCRPPRCETGPNAETGPSVCMGGTCRTPAPIGCAPFRGCTGTRCITQCGSDAQCAAGFFCINGTCGKRPTGGLCSRGADCVSTICAQGRCCATACDSPCVACNVAGNLGTCSPVMAGTEHPGCGDARCSGCNGMGQCIRSAGLACGTPTCGAGVNLNAVVTPTCTALGACLPVPTACPTGELCRQAMCACPVDRTRCGTACVDVQVDLLHCGDCTTICPADNQCLAGDCVPPIVVIPPPVIVLPPLPATLP